MSRKETLKRWYEKAKKEGRLWVQSHPEKFAEYQKKYRIENREKLSVYGKEYNKRRKEHYRELRRGIKKAALDAYGGVCACCGEKQIEFLTIDHINDDGAEHRKSIWGKDSRSAGGNRFYYWLRRNKYPSGFQVLCFNCNFAKFHFDVCPHRKKGLP